MKLHKILFNLTIVILIVLPLGAATGANVAGQTMSTHALGDEVPLNANIPELHDRVLAEFEDEREESEIRSIGLSNVSFTPHFGGVYFFKPSVGDEFCFTAETFSEHIGWLNSIWLKFPHDWVTEGYVYVRGEPACEKSGYFGDFSWDYVTGSHEIRIDHYRYHDYNDHCVATYCIDLAPGAGSGPALVSWFMDYADIHSLGHLCSDDGYRPAGYTSCSFSNPPASIPGSKPIYASWESIPDFKGPARNRAAAVEVDGNLYLIGGETTGTGGRAETVEVFDPKTNEWSTREGLMPIPARNICAAADKWYIFVVGGQDDEGNFLDTIQIYDTKFDAWDLMHTNLPAKISGPGCAVLDSKLYVFGGQTASGYTTGTYIWDFDYTSWIDGNPMPWPPRGYMGSAVVDDIIYVMGGRDLTTPDFQYVDMYNTNTNQWYSGREMNIPRGGPAAFSVGQDLIVCGGGYTAYHNSCEVYDTSTGNDGIWRYLRNTMITGRRTFAYTTVGHDLYAIGGWNNGRLKAPERLSYNNPPYFTTTPTTSVTIGGSYFYLAMATDPDLPYGDQLTITCPIKPAWLSFTKDPLFNHAYLMGSPDDTDVGEHVVRLVVTDQYGLSQTQQFTIRVGGDDINIYLPLILR